MEVIPYQNARFPLKTKFLDLLGALKVTLCSKAFTDLTELSLSTEFLQYLVHNNGDIVACPSYIEQLINRVSQCRKAVLCCAD